MVDVLYIALTTLALSGVVSYTYLATMRMRMTTQLISSVTMVVLVAQGVKPTKPVAHDIETGVV